MTDQVRLTPEPEKDAYGDVPDDLPQYWEDVRLVNCAECERELLGDSLEPERKKLERVLGIPMPRPVAARIKGRPYCRGCTRARYGSVTIRGN